MFHFTYWQLHKCVTRIPVCKQPAHEESREAGIFRESFPRCLIKTEIRKTLQTHYYSKKKVICNALDSVKHTNLSIKLGFISRLYIVKSRKGILFNKMSPTRPAKIQIKIGLYAIDWALDWFNSRQRNELHIVCRSPLCCLSRSLPWWTRPQFSTNKLKVRRPCMDLSFLGLLQVLTANNSASITSYNYEWLDICLYCPTRCHTLPSETASSTLLRLKRPM